MIKGVSAYFISELVYCWEKLHLGIYIGLIDFSTNTSNDTSYSCFWQ